MTKQSLNSKEMLEQEDHFEAAYKSHAKSIYSFLYWRTKNVQLSEDLTSTVFEKAWRSRSKYKGGSVQAWLYRIARNVLIDHWRKKKDLVIDYSDDLEDEGLPSTAEIFDKQLEIESLKTALDRLPHDMSSVIKLRFIEGLSAKQTGDRLKLSESNVRVIQYRALKKLRDYLK